MTITIVCAISTNALRPEDYRRTLPYYVCVCDACGALLECWVEWI